MRYGMVQGELRFLKEIYFFRFYRLYKGEVERIEIAHSNGMPPRLKRAVREDAMMHLYEIKPLGADLFIVRT